MQRWAPRERTSVRGIGKLLVIGSGKGGVGKSTVSVNLAVTLAQHGARVGLLDADAYGPSVPMMLGVRRHRAAEGREAELPLGLRGGAASPRSLKPLLRYGVAIMSVGFFIGEEQAVVPMPEALGVLVRQLLFTVDWGELDYLLVDLPPGTAEPQATLCRELRIDGAILVTTPQDIARMDTARALAMFRTAQIPVLGLVENMASLVCPHCGERVEVFPRSAQAGTPLDDLQLLASIPLDPAAASSADAGHPAVVARPDSAVARAFSAAAEEIAARVRD